MTKNRRNFLKQVATGSSLLYAGNSAVASVIENSSTGTPTRPLNVVMVFPDEMRAQAQQFMQQDPVLTPHIDRFARESCVLRQAVTNYPLCTPSRAMFMTGQYPIHNGMTGNAHDFGALVGIDLSRYARCWSDILKTQNYALGYIGKWHLDAPYKPYVKSYNNPLHGQKWNEWTPPDRRHGFDFWYSYGTYDRHLTPMYWTNQSTRDTPIHISQWEAEHDADVAIAYLNNEGNQYRDPDKPFALVVSMNPPHSPYDQVPQRYLDLYAGKSARELNNRPNVDWDKTYQEGYGPQHAKAYMAMVTGIDEQFGRILEAIDRNGLRENTLVVFFSDHGCCLGAHGEPTKNNAYEESMRIPMMFRLPGLIKARMDDMLFSLPDLYPSVLGLLGKSKEIPATVEGSDFSERIRTGKGETPSSQLFLKVPYGAQSFGQRGVRTDRYTLVVERKDNQALSYTLFDRKNDPYQMKNIAATQPALMAELIERELQVWLEKTGDPWRAAPFATEAAKMNCALTPAKSAIQKTAD